MANLPRTSKSPDDWASRDLTAYNISISYQSPETFFGSHPSTLPAGLDPAFLTTPLPPPDDPALSDTTHRLLQHLALATARTTSAIKAPAIHDFTRALLAHLAFAPRRAALCSAYAKPFTICGDATHDARPDLCVVHGGAGAGVILLVVLERAAAVPRVGAGDPATRVVPHAVAAFQSNNAARVWAGVGALEAMTVPVVVMLGTRPVFYKVPVTRALSEAVEKGEYPAEGTEVAMCVVVPPPPSLDEGMEGVVFRREALCYLEAFREMAKGWWEQFVV